MALRLVNTIDTLDKLLQERDNSYTLNYFLLWIKSILEQHDSDAQREQLEIVCSRLLGTFKKPNGEGGRLETNDYIVAAALRCICKREAFDFDDAFSALESLYGYLEYGDIDRSYILYMAGRLFYDIQEFYDDYIHIWNEFNVNQAGNIEKPSFRAVCEFLTPERIANCIRELIPEESHDINSDYDIVDVLDIAIKFFKRANSLRHKEHYLSWIALSHQKKGIIMPYYRSNIQSQDYCGELQIAIKIYNVVKELSNKSIINVSFNLGLCYFYLIEYSLPNKANAKKIVPSLVENFKAMDRLFIEALGAKDESEVKNEYTFRRQKTDIYFYRLQLMKDLLLKGYRVILEQSSIGGEDPYQQLYKSFLLLKNEINTSGDECKRVEYYVLLAQTVDLLNTQNFKMGNDKKYSNYWKEAKELDRIKFDYPIRIGLAFHDKKYYKDWTQYLGNIRNQFDVGNDYESFQNREVKSHFEDKK